MACDEKTQVMVVTLLRYTDKVDTPVRTRSELNASTVKRPSLQTTVYHHLDAAGCHHYSSCRMKLSFIGWFRFLISKI